jgi:hypothetical protein
LAAHDSSHTWGNPAEKKEKKARPRPRDVESQILFSITIGKNQNKERPAGRAASYMVQYFVRLAAEPRKTEKKSMHVDSFQKQQLCSIFGTIERSCTETLTCRIGGPNRRHPEASFQAGHDFSISGSSRIAAPSKT